MDVIEKWFSTGGDDQGLIGNRVIGDLNGDPDSPVRTSRVVGESFDNDDHTIVTESGTTYRLGDHHV